ncbi:response regulator [Tardiphaga sp.]|uniref:response regulator n=1 Tax=Tardiphaga sp. TaxID=1926292 RepID=UPI0037D9B73E
MPKILVVEDDPFIMMWVEDALHDAGFSVLTATNADRAITYLENDPEITLVFTDIDMPGSMDGLKLALAVRDRWPPVHIVIASGKHRPLASEMPEETVFIPKPYLPRDILGAVRGFH